MARRDSNRHHIWPGLVRTVARGDHIEESDLLLAALGARLLPFLRPAKRHVSGMW